MVFLVGGLGATMWMQNKRFESESKMKDLTSPQQIQKISESLSPSDFTNYPIGQIIPLDEDSKLVRFVLSKQGEPLRLNLNKTISKVNILDPRNNDENSTKYVQEFYPINACDTVGFLDILVSKKEQPDLFKSKTGMSFGIQGPFESEFQYDKKENKSPSITLVAQDVEHGISPSFQLMSEILVNSQGNKSNQPKIHLYYIVSKSNYLLRQSLDDLKIPFQGKLEVTTIMNKGDKKPWEALSENLHNIEKLRQNSTSGCPIIICGTKDFESNMKSHLSKHDISSITLQKDQ
ncbi:predicted protein [Naegleria gruberi]|uniref:Predicted protein n=1 Tax=Naegleria gruberi TaxID=5762 RepID=D2VTD8_NAEGR|nr:uncharacterized protein NAEGRDRAFT_52098 [Naegleria gruberi]EFC39844.1 predicted protein [Naegleria gruberi]|eukprot:XP_002672588.1 predicted protein [Naegleria gruberi strain NEG-M]